MEKLALSAFHNPGSFFIYLVIFGVVLIFLFIMADDPGHSFISGVATIAIVPSIFIFTIVVSGSLVLGLFFVKDAYAETKTEMRRQIDDEYMQEIKALNDMADEIDDELVSELLGNSP